MVSQWNSIGILHQDSPHCSKSKSYCQKWANKQNNSQDGSSSCLCSTTSHGDLKTMNKNANQAPNNSFLSVREDFQQDIGHSSDLDRKKVVFYSWKQTTRRMEQSRRADDQIWRKQTPNFSVGQLYFCGDEGTIETDLRTIISVNQLSIYGAVSDLCDVYKSCHVRTGRPVLVGKSDTLFVPKSSLMKTPTHSTDDPAQEDLLQKYQERVDRL